eukprot:g9378.t1
MEQLQTDPKAFLMTMVEKGKEQVQQLMAKQGEAPKADKSEKKKKQERMGAHQGELKWKTGVASALQQVLPQLEGALALLTEEQSPNLPEALQALIMLAEHQPSFFKSRYQIWIEIMLKLALSPVHPSVRMLSFEWVASLVASAKGLVKAVPDLPSKALTVAFLFLSELEEDEEAERLCKEGEAKVDFLVKNFTFNVAKSPLASLTLRYARSPSWKERTAAALAIRAAGEYADEISADQMTEALLQLTTDPHCRVGSAAFFALGQLCHDRGSNFNQEWCEKFMPAFARGCQEKEVLIARKAIGALESHLHQCSSHEISRFSSMLVNVLVLKLQSSDTNIVVAALEALGALAIAVDDGFDDCYDSLAPLLLRALESTSKDHIHSTIREKAFECISLMGFAVTKEKFAPLAAAALKSLAPKRESDVIDASIDVCELSDCSRDSIQRMCKVLGVDFGHFLPLLVPSILGSLDQLEAFTTDIQGAEDDLVVQLDTSTFRVRTGQLTEAVALIKLLEVLMKHTAECFLQFVLPTSRVLVKLLSQSPSVFTSELREGIYPTWAELVSLKGLDLETKRILVQSFVEKLALDIMNSEEADDIASMARALALIIDRARHEDGTLPGATAQAFAPWALPAAERLRPRELRSDGGGGGQGRSPPEDAMEVEIPRVQSREVALPAASPTDSRLSSAIEVLMDIVHTDIERNGSVEGLLTGTALDFVKFLEFAWCWLPFAWGCGSKPCTVPFFFCLCELAIQIYFLYWMRRVLVPLTFALFLAFLCEPVLAILVKIPRWAGGALRAGSQRCRQRTQPGTKVGASSSSDTDSIGSAFERTGSERSFSSFFMALSVFLPTLIGVNSRALRSYTI